MELKIRIHHVYDYAYNNGQDDLMAALGRIERKMDILAQEKDLAPEIDQINQISRQISEKTAVLKTAADAAKE